MSDPNSTREVILLSEYAALLETQGFLIQLHVKGEGESIHFGEYQTPNNSRHIALSEFLILLNQVLLVR